MNSALVPDFSLSQLLPADAAFATRTDGEQMRLLGMAEYQLESITLALMGLLNGLPTVRHRAGTTDTILRFLQEAGLIVDEKMIVYDTGTEAFELAADLVAQGCRLLNFYPLPDGMHDPKGHLVAPDLWRDLNAKSNLSWLAPSAHLANRTIKSIAEARKIGFTRPVWAKLATLGATGVGHAVRYCPDKGALDAALTTLGAMEPGSDIILEEDVPILTCWAANIVVQPRTVHLAGGAIQVFSAPGVQSGSLIDPNRPLPEEAAAIAVAAGHMARERGFIGPAGLDIGQTPDGRFVVFDPNFRTNASLPQVLLHSAAARRSGLGASLSTGIRCSLSVPEIIRRVTGAVKDQWFVPLRVIDAAYLPAMHGASHLAGFIMANLAADLPIREAELRALLDS